MKLGHFRVLCLAILCLMLLIPDPLPGNERKIKTLFSSIDKNNLNQLLAFYELYPETQEGNKALARSRELLTSSGPTHNFLKDLGISASGIEGIVSLVNKQPNRDSLLLTETQLREIERVASKLPNRKLKGFYVTSEDQIHSLAPEEIDVARAVILSQMDSNDNKMQRVRSYEAAIDLMALQIRTKLPLNCSQEQKIRAINTFIFDEMGFRFPPQSKYVNDVDLYTSLPSVIDSRQGVCLGVSILYLSIAQRLALPLEIVTPPGHIFLRYNTGESEINIETTARGVHIDSDEYLDIKCKSLQLRDIKEVVGMAHMNHAGACLKEENYSEALKRYQKALPYLSNDSQLMELMGYCHILIGEEEIGESLLKEVLKNTPEHCLDKNTLCEDYLSKKADPQALKALFLHVEDNRQSLLKKKDALIELLFRYPEFREGWQSLASTWLQMHRGREALAALEKCHELDSDDCSVEYTLAALYASRMNYKGAWEHLKNAENIAMTRNCYPKVLKNARRELTFAAPE